MLEKTDGNLIASIMDVEETKIEENSEVKIAEIVEDIDDTRENPE